VPWTDPPQLSHAEIERRVDSYAMFAFDLLPFSMPLKEMEQGVRTLERRDRRRVDPAHKALLGGSCVYCGDISSLTVDHLVPISRGGTSALSNLARACWTCNKQKLDFTPEEWRDWRLSEGMPWPPLCRADELRQIMADLRRQDQERAS